MRPATAIVLLIAVLLIATAAFAAPAGATKTHHDGKMRYAPHFSMPACLKAARRIYGPQEAQAACLDAKFGL